MKPRVCAAIIREDKILMVRHEHDGRNYWTLPGGGIEKGEDHAQAVIREVLEETHLEVKVIQLLFEEAEANRRTYCYLAKIAGNGEVRLGSDPEEKDLPVQDRMLREVRWQSLEKMKKDRQVSKILLWLHEKMNPDYLENDY